MRAIDIQPGMRIYGADGAELGRVHEVWAQTHEYGYLPVSQYLLNDYGPIAGTRHLFTGGNGYLHIKQGDLLGFGGRDLYLPLYQVGHVTPGTCATVRSSATACKASYEAIPTSLARAV